MENVVTHGDYRKKGYATACLNYAKQIALEATDMGRPLYEKYGFVKMEDEMELI